MNTENNIILQNNSKKIFSETIDNVQTKKWRTKFIRSLMPYAMVAPALIILSVFVLYPIFYMIYLSFFKWDMMGTMEFIGIKNFVTMAGDSTFWLVMKNTFVYMIFTVTFSITLALLLALYLKNNTKTNALLQSVVFTPYIISLISVSFIWMWLMDSQYGLLNYVLHVFGIKGIGWLDDPNVAMFSLILVSVWKSVGYYTLIIVSAMQSIPEFLYEAARLDKAGKAAVFFKITLPMLSPTLFFLILMDMIACFKVFETVNVMTQGGPMNSTNTLVYDIYTNGFSFYKIGYGSALGVVLMVIIGICTILYFKILSKRIHYR